MYFLQKRTLKKIGQILLKILIFGALTILTQIGGVIYLLSIFLNLKIKYKFRFKKLIVFSVLYLFITFLVVPHIAPIFGREPIKHSKSISPTNYMTIVLNRNYVRPELNKLLKETSNCLGDGAIKINYLDANFPFINKFPLLPHLSHNDGKKLDLSLIYETPVGVIKNKQKSRSGYGVFENPTKIEQDQIEICKSKGYFQYDFPKYLTLGAINKDLIFSKKGTKKLINCILKNPKIGKIFIEPHLKSRLKLRNKKVRYHGCRAVRHDDHIHIQLK